jgi:hypothetical protein
MVRSKSVDVGDNPDVRDDAIRLFVN